MRSRVRDYDGSLAPPSWRKSYDKGWAVASSLESRAFRVLKTLYSSRNLCQMDDYSLLSTSLNLSHASTSMELAIFDFVLEYRLLH